MLKVLRSLFVIFLLSSPSYGAFDHQHRLFDQLLKEHVVFRGKQSLVHYQNLKKKPQKLHLYLAQLSAVSKKTYEGFSPPQQLAFLINAYNAFTLKIIIDHYPLKSIKDIGFLFNNAWKKKFFTLLDEPRHLDFVEHKMIRAWFKEPRIHFAVNCASISCPSLRRDAFVGSKLEQQLQAALLHFLSNRKKNYIDRDKKRLYVSKIFDWYEGDFEQASGSLVKYFLPHLDVMTDDEAVKNTIKKRGRSPKFLPYDWGLNEAK